MGVTADQRMRQALWKSDLNEYTREAMLELFRALNEHPTLRVAQVVTNAAGEERNFACPEVYYLEDHELASVLMERRTTLL